MIFYHSNLPGDGIDPKGHLEIFVSFCFVLCFVLLATMTLEHNLHLVASQVQKKTQNIAPPHTPLKDNELEHQAFHPLEHFTTGLERIGEGICFFTLHLNKNKHYLTKSEYSEETTLRGLEFQNGEQQYLRG